MEAQLNELERRVERLEQTLESYSDKMTAILSSVTRIEEKLEGRKGEDEANSKLTVERIDNLKSRVAKLEDNQSWIVKAVIGEVIAVIALIVTTFIKRGI